MSNRSKAIVLVVVIALTVILLPGCSTLQDLEFDEYVGTFSVPNLGKRTLSLNALTLTIRFNEGKVVGEGKAVLEDIPQADFPLFTETFNFKFTGTYDGETGMMSGIVGVTGGNACTRNCKGVDSSTYNHSSYWRAQEVNGKITNGKISAYPDFKTSTFVFEASLVKNK